jgi:hypothetical protein
MPISLDDQELTDLVHKTSNWSGNKKQMHTEKENNSN